MNQKQYVRLLQNQSNEPAWLSVHKKVGLASQHRVACYRSAGKQFTEEKVKQIEVPNLLDSNQILKQDR